MRIEFSAVLALVTLVSIPLAHADEAAPVACPDATLGETALDCPWAGISRALQSQVAAGNPDLLPSLEKLAPDLASQLRSISELPSAWIELWGTSINFDEFAHARIVNPEFLQAISRETGIQVIRAAQTLPDRQLVHAGTEHTYGYLFSTIKTPFGYKRSRWVSGEVERMMGLPAGLMGPLPAEGSLFANVTYFAGRIALRDAPVRLKILDLGAKAVPAALRDYDYASLKPTRIEETVQVPLTDGAKPRRVTIRTDLVPFTVTGTGDTDAGLLIYSVDDESQDGPRLVTMFPAAAGTAHGLLDPATLGDSVQIATRYNGYVQGLTEHPTAGMRRIIAP